MPAQQEKGRGKALAAARLPPKLQRTQRRVITRPSQGHMARHYAAMRSKVANGADRGAIVATRGSPNGRFFTLWGDQTGI